MKGKISKRDMLERGKTNRRNAQDQLWHSAIMKGNSTMHAVRNTAIHLSIVNGRKSRGCERNSSHMARKATA